MTQLEIRESRALAAVEALRLEDKILTPSDRALLQDALSRGESREFLSEVVRDLLLTLQEVGKPHDF